MNSKVSVIVPFYNVSDYLSECINSVLDQTLSDIELILVDDGSSDGSEKIADDAMHQNPARIKVIHQSNQGPAVARNAGLELACGDYVHFLDSDDMLKKEALDTLYNEASAKNLDILLFCAQVFSTDPSLNEDVNIHRDEFIRTSGIGRITSGRESIRTLYEVRKEEYPAPVWTRLYNRSYLLKSGFRYPAGVIHEDEDFGFFTYFYSERIEQIADVLLLRRLRSSSIMYTKKLKDSVLGYKNIYNKLIDIIENKSTPDDDRNLMILHSERMIFYTLLFYMKADESSRAESRNIIDTYINRAFEYRKYYCKKVCDAMDMYKGLISEKEISLPEIPYLCYL